MTVIGGGAKNADTQINFLSRRNWDTMCPRAGDQRSKYTVSNLCFTYRLTLLITAHARPLSHACRLPLGGGADAAAATNG